MATNYQALDFVDEKYDFAGNYDKRSLGHDDDPETNCQTTHGRPLSQPQWIWVVHALLFFSSLSLCVRGYLYSMPTTPRFLEKFAIYSPATSAIQYKDVQFDGKSSTTSPYVGTGPEVDAAWAAISSDAGHILVPASTLPKIGKSVASSSAVYNPETGALKGYLATLDVFHQLSCLDMLRQATYKEERNWRQSHDEREAHHAEKEKASRLRLDHCIEVLRQNLMCNADVGLVTYRYRSDSLASASYASDVAAAAEPDYSTWHTCRNYDRVLQWAMEHKMDRSMEVAA